MNDDKKIINLSHFNKSNGASNTKKIHLNKDLLKNTGYQIFRGYNRSVDDLIFDLSSIPECSLYFSPKIGSISHDFSINQYSEELSEQVSAGGFHTDFMFQECPPDYVALYCLEADPKFPFYGRNQVVSVKKFISIMQLAYNFSLDDLLGIVPKYLINGKIYEIPLLQMNKGIIKIKLHTSLLNDELNFKIQNLSFKNAIHDACLSACDDFVLNKGDLVIISNNEALHRRGECSFKFDYQTIHSRKMSTIRFSL